MRDLWRWCCRSFALLVVLATFTWAALYIYTHRQAEAPPGTTVQLRIGHWQLEGGVRDAINEMAAEYSKLHPEVHIVQDGIPEGTYGQWMTTQLMGGTAPDIMEVGLGLPYNVLLGYYSRYFLPMTEYVNQPNPYNAGTELEGVPWLKTYKDGMRNSYVEELQEYMKVPLAQFGIRVFYNRDLLIKLTGRREPPTTWREFRALCEQISQQQDEKGRPYLPIAGSGYHFGMWDSQICQPLTYGAVRVVDYNRDGAVGNDELYVGLKTGRLTMDFPPYRARFALMRQITGQFPTGFTGLSRDDAVMPFAQQRAVFISTGTWDAGSLLEQAKGEFELGVMDFPLPGKDDPEFGAVLEGPVYERPDATFPFCVTRTSKHPEVAVDFLRFLGSKQGNERLNHTIGWIPAIQGTSVPPLLKAFEPHLNGVFAAMPLTLGGETIIRWEQLFSLYQVHQISYDELARQFMAFYLQRGSEEYDELMRNRQRALPRDEQLLAGMRARALLAPAERQAALWIKYRRLASARTIVRDPKYLVYQQRLSEPELRVAPYEFSAAALARVKANLQSTSAAEHH